MSDIQVLKFDPRHLEIMVMRDVEASGSFKLGDAYDRVDKIAKESTQAATFLYDGRILFCAGFNVLWPGVLEVWMIPSIHVKDTPMLSARRLKRYVDAIADTFKAHRIQTTSHDDLFHERWMNFLGFKKEGTFEKFTHDKKNMCMYARIF